MSILIEQPSYPRVETASAPQPLLAAVPKMLEYRSDADPDAEFIPKTIAGFAIGTLVMGICLNVAEVLFLHPSAAASIWFRMGFTMGITGVSASLLLVGLKVRADHSSVNLFARHWLNSLATGAMYAFLIWGPWILMEKGVMVNRFVAAAVWMVLMSYPAVAAKWTVEPHPEHKIPGAS